MFYFFLIDLPIPLTANRLTMRWIFALTFMVSPPLHPEMLLLLYNITCNCSVLSQPQEWMIFLLLFKDRPALSHSVTSLRDKNGLLQLIPFQTSAPPLQFFFFNECSQFFDGGLVPRVSWAWLHPQRRRRRLSPPPRLAASQTNMRTWLFNRATVAAAVCCFSPL